MLVLNIWKPEVKGENRAASVCILDLNEKILAFLKIFISSNIQGIF